MSLPVHLPCSMTVALYALVSQKDTHGLLADRSSVFRNFVLCGLAALQQSLLCLVTSQTQPPDEEFQVLVPLYEILCFTKYLRSVCLSLRLDKTSLHRIKQKNTRPP